VKLLIGLTYYRPYTSGLTIYAERLATTLVRRGHQVTVLAAQHERSLPLRESVDGVEIVRAPVAGRLSKGVLMPELGRLARELMRSHDVLNLHLPQLDSPRLAFQARRMHVPVILTYHCDIRLPPGPLNAVAQLAVNVSNEISARYATRIVTYTQDYADHSSFLRRHRKKLTIIPPPVDLPAAAEDEILAFARRWSIQGPVIGMVARLATEKGVEILLRALPLVLEARPDARVMFAGPHENVLGEEAYARRIAPLTESLGGRWVFVGNLSQNELAAFYANCSTVVVPSLNSTEAFGLVQVEAMLSGTPSIASALPGVRQPVLTTGMGEVVPVGDSVALAHAIIRVIEHRDRYVRPRAEITALYNNDRTAAGYEELASQLADML
jgi:glycosyltransferase involved in cell wall biosynthesis